MDPAFADIGSKLDFVRESLGMGDDSKAKSQEGCGWEGRYELYCVKCHVEITIPFIDEKDPKRIKRCPKCKESNELWSPEERKQQLQRHMDELEEEEKTMKARKKRMKKYRKRFPLYLQFRAMGLGEVDDEKGSGLNYKETEMWIATVDLDEYLDNLWYIPRKIKEVTDRAWDLHDKYSICREQMDIAIKVLNYAPF